MAVISMLAFILVTINLVQAGTPKLDKKERHQKTRIIQGVRSGELTRKETRHLIKGQRQLHGMERRAKADGVVTRKERVRLNLKAEQESARIYHNKHDKQKRPDAR